MTNLDTILKSRDITLLTKVRLVNAMVFPVVMYGCESWTVKKAECQRIWCFWTVVLEKTIESPLDSQEDWCWSWNPNTLAILCEERTHLKRPCCWERLRAGGEGHSRRWDGWMASPTQWTWVWVNSGSWWWTREAWRAAVHGVAKIRTRLNDWTEGNIMQRSDQIRSVAQSYPTLCDPMNHSTPGLPVHQQLPEFNQTHVHWVGDAIQPSHSLLSPSPPALNLSQQQGLLKWVSHLHQVAKVLEFQLQHQSSN